MTTTTIPSRTRSGHVTVGDYTGHAVIIPGHDLSPETVRAAVHDHFGEADTIDSQEVFWHYITRVKWCSRHADWPCDLDGEWHGHWPPVKPNTAPSTHFTVAWPASPR